MKDITNERDKKCKFLRSFMFSFIHMILLHFGAHAPLLRSYFCWYCSCFCCRAWIQFAKTSLGLAWFERKMLNTHNNQVSCDKRKKSRLSFSFFFGKIQVLKEIRFKSRFTCFYATIEQMFWESDFLERQLVSVWGRNQMWIQIPNLKHPRWKGYKEDIPIPKIFWSFFGGKQWAT